MDASETLERCLGAVRTKRKSFSRIDSLAGVADGYTRKMAKGEVPAKAYQVFHALVEDGIDPNSLFLPPVMWREDDTSRETPTAPHLLRPTIDEVARWMSSLDGSFPDRDDPMIEYCNVFQIADHSLAISVVGVGRLSVTAINAGCYSPRQMERMIANSPNGDVYERLATDMNSLEVGQASISEAKYQTLYTPPHNFHNGVTRTVRMRCSNNYILNFAETITLSLRRDPDDPFSGNPVPAVMATRVFEHP
jgi:hypothetical protein